jgi:TRAP-type C4-dicarboxylate transport system substrate-binding protein
VLLAINQTTEAISSGTIDGATAPPPILSEYGIGRVTTNHFMIDLGGVPIALVMNRRKFESLPAAAQAVIRKYGGQWLSDYTVKSLTAWDHEVLAALEHDPKRTVVYPSAADEKAIQAAFDDVIREYAGSSDHSRALLARVRAMLADQSTSE